MSNTRQASQIVSQPQLYATGCTMTWASNTTITVSAGQLRDSTNMYDINVGNYLGINPSVTANTTTTLNMTVNGVNGLDVGTFAASSTYYVYVVADSTGYNQPCVIASLATQPYLPLGYSIWRRVGQFISNSSTHIILFYQTGTKSQRTYQYDAPIILSLSGSTTPVAVALTASVPNLFVVPVYLSATLNPATAANSASIQPTGGTGFPVVISAPVASAIQKFAPFRITPAFNTATPAELSISYETTSGSDALTLSVIGYDDYI
jgi:hypothetical protein